MFSPEDIENSKQTVKQAYEEIYKYIQHDEDACKFVLMYGEYVEMIDDIVDEEKDVKLILKAFNHAMCLFSSPFWQKHSQQLMLIDCTINNEYGDSVVWERGDKQWQRVDASVMCHCGYNMLYAVVCLVAGYDAMRSFSLKFRQWSHIKHRLPNH